MVTVANPDAKRLYDDLLSNYNKLVRPVANVSDALTVKIKLKLSQLIDVVNTNNTKSPPKNLLKKKKPTNDCRHLSVIAFALPSTEFPSRGIGGFG